MAPPLAASLHIARELNITRPRHDFPSAIVAVGRQHDDAMSQRQHKAQSNAEERS